MKKLTIFSLLILAGCVATPKVMDEARSFTIVSLNDVYRIDANVDGKGGLDKLKTILDGYEEDNTLILHGGDFLSPSVLSESFKGEQMIDTLNAMNGLDGTFNKFLYVVPGNHEFDFRGDAGEDILYNRIKQSEFQWLTSNVTWKPNNKTNKFDALTNLTKAKIIDIGGTKVGIFGLTIHTNPTVYADISGQYIEHARQGTMALRKLGAEFIIALTHITIDDDKSILQTLGADGPDLIIGGHEHVRHQADVAGRYVLKADSDLESIVVTTVTNNDGTFLVSPSFIEVTSDVEQDTVVRTTIDNWFARYYAEKCNAPRGEVCENPVLGSSSVKLAATSAETRRFETNTGNWITDVMREGFKGDVADIAFINSGTIRINRDIDANELITDGLLAALLPYDPTAHLIELTGAELKAVINHSISNWQASGHWLQVSGFAFKFDPVRGAASDLQLITQEGLVPISDDQVIRAVTVGYLLDEDGPQDGYKMLGTHSVLPSALNWMKVRVMLKENLITATDNTIAPVVEGRICNPQRQSTCLIK